MRQRQGLPESLAKADLDRVLLCNPVLPFG